MRRFIQKTLFVIFFQSLYVLSIFYIPVAYYPQWGITFFIFLLFIIFISIKIIPSAKSDKLFKQIIKDYENSIKIKDSIKIEAMKLKLECPQCKTASNYWSFLEEGFCKNCRSNLWPTILHEQDTKYNQLFEKIEKNKNFNDKIPGKFRQRLKNYLRTGSIQ